MLLGVCPASYGVLLSGVVLCCRYTSYTTVPCSQLFRFFNGGVFECDVDLWQYYVCCTRSGVTRCTLFMVLFLCRMCRCGLHAAMWCHIGTLMRRLAAEPRSIAGLLFPLQYLCGTIFVTSYSMVWDWRVSRARPMHFIISGLLPFGLLLFFLSLLSVYGLVLWGWGLRTDSQLIALSQPWFANFF